MPKASRTLLTKAQMAESIAALAKSIREAHAGDKEIALVGIFTRGVPLAQRLAAAISASGEVKVHFGTIDITQYRDDLSTFQMVPKLEGSDIDFDLDGIDVVLCDEVIYTAVCNWPCWWTAAAASCPCSRTFPPSKCPSSPVNAWRCALRRSMPAATPAPSKPSPPADDSHASQRPPRHRLPHG
jgi:hypothetical protein